MSKKPVFTPAVRPGFEPLPETKYDPLIFTRGHEMWRFALHRDPASKSAKPDWCVSDPVSGRLILRVKATYKGIPVANGNLTLKQAREFALVDLDALVDRVSLERFSSRISEVQL